MNSKYLSAAETAKLIRVQLSKTFPGIKFYVRSKTYSGGASIDIDWIDGPGSKLVDRVVKSYEGADFDGMIDLKTYNTSYLLPDGTAARAHVEGTQDAHGYIREQHYSQPAGAVEVHFGADYIFTHRHVTPGFAKPIIKAVCAEFGYPEPTYYERTAWIGGKEHADIVTLDWDCCSPQWGELDHHINAEVHKRLSGEVAQVVAVEEPAPIPARVVPSRYRMMEIDCE